MKHLLAMIVALVAVQPQTFAAKKCTATCEQMQVMDVEGNLVDAIGWTQKDCAVEEHCFPDNIFKMPYCAEPSDFGKTYPGECVGKLPEAAN